jgi:hypothetical protein
LGTVTAVSGDTVSVKTDAGGVAAVTVPESARVLRTTPGQKTLADAAKIAVSDIAAGDRVLMLVEGDPPTASIVVVNKQSDIAARQAQEREDWQKRGVGGLVKAVNVANGTLTVASGREAITIHTTPATIVRRYAPDSVSFSDAKASTLAEIHPGDEVTARGNRRGDEVTAEEIVSGSFRNIAGTVQSTDPAAGTFTVKDLMTKKTITVHTTTDSDLRKLEPPMAQMLAVRLKSAGSGAPGGAHGATGGAGERPHPSPRGSPAANGAGGNSSEGGSLAQILQRSPAIHIQDLHKGEAVLIVATSGSPDEATAIRLVAGVEPMLEASASGSQNMLSSAWSLGGGSGGGDSGEGSP